MNIAINHLGPVAEADAAAGKRVVSWGNGHWCSFPSGGCPEMAYWGTGIARHQRARVAADLAAIGRLAVGQSHEAVRGYHPRHGEKFATVTRIV